MQKFQPTSAKNEKVVVSIRLENSKLEMIDEVASKTKISRNELICQCLDYALKNIEFKNELPSQKWH